MLYIALALLFIAILFFWQSNRQRRAAGLPGGRVIYTDTRGWERWRNRFSIRHWD